MFGEVTVTRLAYRRRGHCNLYPADAALNLPVEKHSHVLRKLAAIEASRGSFDDTADCQHIKMVMVAAGLEVVGIRQNGIIAGYIEESDLHRGCCREVMRPIDDSNVVADTLPLAGLILRLKDRPRLFVLALGQVSGVVNRGAFAFRDLEREFGLLACGVVRGGQA